MKLNFVKLSPTQNMTLLVTDPVPRSHQAELAEKLMAYDGVHAEQVGFVERANLPGARARLQMMGGEFCGNASMSLAVLLAREDALELGREAEYALEVSGADGIVRCRVRRDERHYWGTASMPLPEDIRELELLPGVRFPVIRFPGIVHVLSQHSRLTREQAEEYAPVWCERLCADALGVLLFSEDDAFMCPLVYVRSTLSNVWESGCGSGSAALGAYLAHKDARSVRAAVAQPGGTLVATADYSDGRVSRLEIEGKVRLVAEGIAYIDD